MTDSPTPPDGWYPDPAGGGGLRRWNGTSWTDELRSHDGSAVAPTVDESTRDTREQSNDGQDAAGSGVEPASVEPARVEPSNVQPESAEPESA
uniref:DUF2510 domain-containing protein n=1 Tax=uncultured Microbacterium sp. TaxID=191216 RepID=UPI0025DA4A6D